jgi:hypothetical protein
LNGAANCEKVAATTKEVADFMKRLISIAVLILAASVVQGQDITGDWQGDLAAGGGELRIVLHITKSDDGKLKATLDSPDQAVVGMPVDTITVEGSKLRFTANVVKGSYDGTIKNGNTISGNWSQPNKMPLEFKRTTTPIKLDHPPAPPSDIDGTWEGTLETPSQGKLHVVFHLKNTGDGLTATMDSPDQNVKGWPATTVARKGSTIKIEMRQLGGTFQGKLNKDLTVISGDWTQGPNYALTLRRAKAEPADASKQSQATAPAKN